LTPDTILTLIGAAFFMALVALLSWWKTRGHTESREGYFLAGRGLTGLFIAGSLLLTNLSAEQLVGLNGSAYGFNMSAMAWEVTAGFAIIIMALVFLPRYLAGGYTTLPEFLSSRFDEGVRRLTVLLFLLGYGLVTIPSVLYSGAIAVLRLFDVPAMTGLPFGESLVVVILVIGLIGAAYAVFGGLRAVAVSDTLNGVGLLIVGFAVPIFGLIALGQGSLGTGLDTLLSSEVQKLDAIGSDSDPTPFLTIFTGMIFANLFYWGTNQYVIQRTLGAASLAEGQKGVLLAGFLKLLVPFMMMIPGVIAYHLYGPGMAPIDLAFPRLVADVLPVWMAGFFLAVLLGAVFSSFNSLLNSAATLFALDIWQPMLKREVGDAELIRVAKIASVLLALASFVAAPLLQFAPEGLWQVVRVFTGFYNIPVIALVVAALFVPRVPAWSAKLVIAFHVIAYALLRFVFAIDLNFVHIYAILFGVELAMMVAAALFAPAPVREAAPARPRSVDLTPWRGALPVSFLLVGCIIALYIAFSPLGLASGRSSNPQMYVWLALVLVLTALSWRVAQRMLTPAYTRNWQEKFRQ